MLAIPRPLPVATSVLHRAVVCVCETIVKSHRAPPLLDTGEVGGHMPLDPLLGLDLARRRFLDALGTGLAAEPGDTRELLDLGAGDLFGRAPAELEQGARQLLGRAFDLAHGAARLLLELLDLGLGVDVDAPA